MYAIMSRGSAASVVAENCETLRTVETVQRLLPMRCVAANKPADTCRSERRNPARTAGRLQAVVRTEQAGAGGDGEA